MTDAQDQPTGTPAAAAVSVSSPDVTAALATRMRRALWLMVGIIAALLAISTIVQIDGAVVGSGALSAESRVKTIAHPTGGILSRLLVRDGDRVRANDIVMEFATDVSGPSSELSNQSLDQLLARQARLDAERSGRSQMRWPAGYPPPADDEARAALAQERRLLQLRQSEMTGNRRLLDERISQFNELNQSYRVQINSARRQLEIIQPELAGLRQLYEKRLVTVNRLNQLERQAVELEGSIGALEANIAQTNARISEVREQKLTIEQSRRAEAGAELAQVDAAIADQRIRIADADDRFSRSVVRAPAAGVIEKLAFTTIGSAVPGGTPIAQIVPDKDALIVEASVRPSDIDQLKVGQPARIMFPTLEQNVTPELAGKLIYLAADATDDGRGGPPFFRIRVELPVTTRNMPIHTQLRAGLPAEVFLRTGSRSLMSYLLKPLLDQINHAFRQ